MNILFTSTGRRGYLIRYFKEALNGSGLIHAANSIGINSSFDEADKSIITPLIYDKNYIPFLIDYCKSMDIGALIPLFDIDLPILSKNKQKFIDIGVNLVCSSPKVISVCNDKWKTYNFLNTNRFNTPKTYVHLDQALELISKGKLKFPIILKPRFGMGSIGTYIVENLNELLVLYSKSLNDTVNSYLKYESKKKVKEQIIIIQEMLVGQEYGLDIVNDLNGNYVTTFVKKKLAMRAGETDAAMIVLSEPLYELGKLISRSLCHVGNLDVDVFMINEKAFILEINARFGGGYPFSHIGGANLPKAIVSWLMNKPVDPNCFYQEEGIIGVKSIEPKKSII